MDTGTQIKTLELDKICRVCLQVKKDMRPLFGEMIADMLMDCARIQVISIFVETSIFLSKHDEKYFLPNRWTKLTDGRTKFAFSVFTK